MVKNMPAMQETWVQFLGQEDPLEKRMATHSSIFAWRIPWTEKPGGLQSMGLQRVGHDWATDTHRCGIILGCTMISWDPEGQRKGSDLLWTLLDGSPALTQCAWPPGSWDNLRLLPKLRARRINSAGLSRQVLPWNQGAHFMGWRSEAKSSTEMQSFPQIPCSLLRS